MPVIRMTMPMVQIRVMRMFVPHRLMAMPMRMRLGDCAVMRVLMMHIVTVQMIMLQRFVIMDMIMPL